MELKLFQNIVLNTTQPNACSPKNPGPNWRGILINVPDKIQINTDTKTIPLCGLYTVNMLSLSDNKPMRIFLLNRQTKEKYSGDVLEKTEDYDAPHPDVKNNSAPEKFQNLAVSSYFNRNILEFLSLPRQPGNYEVWVEYGGLRSNTALMQII